MYISTDYVTVIRFVCFYVGFFTLSYLSYFFDHCFSLDYLTNLFTHYGFWVIGIVVTLESMGFPLPAESLLITSALFCATTHKLPIQNVIIAGIIGAIMGDNFGYLIGRSFGMQILHRHGAKIGLTEQRLLLGNYMFSKYGGVIVFSGRFIAILRMFAALLAGANRMPWRSFLFYNTLGGIFWAGGYTTCAYFLGTKIERLSGYLAIVFGGITAVIILTLLVLFKYNEKRLTRQALDAAQKEAANNACPPIETTQCSISSTTQHS